MRTLKRELRPSLLFGRAGEQMKAGMNPAVQPG
jgi:hypothetical protein